MKVHNWLLLLLNALLLNLAFSGVADATPKYLFKVASIAPDGSVWAKRFQDFADEVEKKSNGEVGFKVYLGGVMGDDTAMYRKMQIGQLHGGGFTMTGIGPVVDDFRVMGIPFLFNSYDEADYVRKGLTPLFQKEFADKGLELVAMTEVGFVYSMSTRPLLTLDDLARSKSWVPAGDPISETFLKQLGITPTPLAIPDVLTSLQTGLIETVYNSLYGSIVLQWYIKAKHISDIPFGYAYGAFLLDKKRFSKLPPNYAQLINTVAEKHFSLLIQDTRKSNEEARQVLIQNGVQFHVPDEDEINQLSSTRAKTVRVVEGKEFSVAIYEKTMQLLDEFRAQNN